MNLIRNNKNSYGNSFENHLLEQYKLYAEMTDRISSRRMLANSFFVGIHTALITAFTIMIKENIIQKNLIGVAPFVAAIVLCFLWWRVIKSYRQLNSGKFKILHEFEKILPAAPYDEEWAVLESGKNINKYLSITRVENFVPICFLILYIFIATSLLFN